MSWVPWRRLDQTQELLRYTDSHCAFFLIPLLPCAIRFSLCFSVYEAGCAPSSGPKGCRRGMGSYSMVWVSCSGDILISKEAFHREKTVAPGMGGPPGRHDHTMKRNALTLNMDGG